MQEDVHALTAQNVLRSTVNEHTELQSNYSTTGPASHFSVVQ